MILGADYHGYAKYGPYGEIGRAAAHGVVGGAISEATGGEFRHGFYASFVGSVAGSITMSGPLSGDGYGYIAARTAIVAVAGGTASVIGGGKFANGAVTSAFQHLFNSEGENLKRLFRPIVVETETYYYRPSQDAGQVARNVIGAARRFIPGRSIFRFLVGRANSAIDEASLVELRQEQVTSARDASLLDKIRGETYWLRNNSKVQNDFFVGGSEWYRHVKEINPMLRAEGLTARDVSSIVIVKRYHYLSLHPRRESIPEVGTPWGK